MRLSLFPLDSGPVPDVVDGLGIKKKRRKKKIKSKSGPKQTKKIGYSLVRGQILFPSASPRHRERTIWVTSTPTFLVYSCATHPHPHPHTLDGKISCMLHSHHDKGDPLPPTHPTPLHLLHPRYRHRFSASLLISLLCGKVGETFRSGTTALQ